jgi:magnesium-transporting ATPase (P-type)
MKNVVQLYRRHRTSIETYLKDYIKSYSVEKYLELNNSPLSDAKFIQLAYSMDENLKQTSPMISKKNIGNDTIGKDKTHYFFKIILDSDNFYIASPYIHHYTGLASISIVIKVDDTFYIFDIDLIAILEELNLLEYNDIHDKFTRGIYFIGATVLAVVAFILIIYGGYELHVLFYEVNTPEFFNSMFTSIIAVTLGIAIFDLAKQIFEHEVLFHHFSQDENKQYKVLGKFLVSIVIALSIETLMVVFKLALTDYKSMLSAFYLLIGTTVMFVGLAYFYKTVVNAKKSE